jgi:hypothetical protein
MADDVETVEEKPIPRGKTRWRRFGIAFMPAFGLVVTTMVLMAMGVLAMPVTVSGTKFTVSGSSLTTTPGTNAFVQIANVDPTGGTPVAVATTILANGGTIANLDQVVCGPTGLPGPLANLKVEITANPAVAAGGLVVDATDLTGNATFTNIQIGVPYTNPRTSSSTFAQTADNVSITNLHQTAVYTQAGTFTLTGLHLTASFIATCP